MPTIAHGSPAVEELFGWFTFREEVDPSRARPALPYNKVESFLIGLALVPRMAARHKKELLIRSTLKYLTAFVGESLVYG
jgi:hypothetical protein